MDSLKTPTVTYAAEVVLTDGTEMVGNVFLPAISKFARPMRPEERLNDDDSFVPMLREGSRHAILLNKSHVALIRVERSEYDRFSTGMPEEPHRRIALECRGTRYEGTVTFALPWANNRVLDFMNRPEPFVAMHTASYSLLIKKTAITLISESDEGTLRPTAGAPTTNHTEQPELASELTS